MMMFPEVEVNRFIKDMQTFAEEFHQAAMTQVDDIVNIYEKVVPEVEDRVRSTRSFDSEFENLDPELRRLRKKLKQAINEARVRATLANNFEKVASTIDIQFQSTIEQLTGTAPVLNDAPLERFLQKKIQENVERIVTLPERHFNRIRKLVLKSAREGRGSRWLQEQIPRQGATAKFDAERIARDQAGDVQGRITEKRFRDAGLNLFRWETVGDSRVREGHRKAANEDVGYGPGIFKMDEGAPSALSDTGFPGLDIQCRCVRGIVRREVRNRAA